jgi:hypothetical protein
MLADEAGELLFLDRGARPTASLAPFAVLQYLLLLLEYLWIGR